MRIDRLDIRRYGPLTPRVLDFSGGAEGVHVVYGGNEWGKSLSLQALEQALFSIPKSFDGFSPADLAQVELALALGRRGAGPARLAFVRRRQSVVAADSGTPIEERQIQACLGGITAETFRQMYGLSTERIREGGRLLQNAKGDIASTLFAAATGLERVRDVGQSFDVRLKGLFSRKSDASKPELNKSLQAMRASFRDFSGVLQTPAVVERLEAQLQEAADGLAAIERILRDHGARLGHLGRLRATRVAAGQLHACRERLERLGTPALLADSFRPRLDKARPAVAAANTTEEQLEAALAEKRRRRDAIVLDDRVVGAAETITSLLGFTAELQGIDTSLRERSDEIDRLTKASAGFLRDIAATTGRALRESAIQSAGTLGRIESLIQEHGGVTTACKERASQLEDGRKQLEDLEAELAAFGVVGDDGEIVRRLAEIRDAGDLEKIVAAARQKLAAAVERHEASCRRLELGAAAGSIETLRVPALGEIHAFRDRFRELDQARAELDRETDEVNAAIGSLESRIQLLEEGVDLPAEGELERVRGERDSLLRATTSAFESGLPAADARQRLGEIARLVERADAIVDGLLVHADSVSQRRQHRITIEGHCKQAGRIDERRQRLVARVAETEGEWKGLWEPAGVVPRAPVAMEGWIATHAECLEQADDLRQLGREIDGLDRQIAADRGVLAEILGQLGDPSVADATRRQLIDRLSKLLDLRQSKAAARKQTEEQLGKARQGIPRLETLLDEATKQRDGWLERWAECMEVLDQPKDVSVDGGRYLLDAMRKVAANESAIGDKRDRIAGMQERRDAIHGLMRQVAEVLGVPFDPAGIQALGRAASERLREAEAAARERKTLDDDIARAERAITAVQQDRAASEAVMKTLRDEARVETDAALDEAWEKSQQFREARRALVEAEEAFVREAGQADRETLLAECLATTAEAIDRELAEIDRDSNQERARRDAARDRQKTLQDQLDALGNDRAARAAAECRMHEAAVLERVHEYVPLRLAALALSRASRRYRDEHHAPVLGRASVLFERITCGRYAEIRLAENDLYAVRAGGGAESVLQRHMSEGTRDQIYLALRLAALEHSHAQGAEPLPLVLDDGLVHFDDERTKAMLGVLADVSAGMQVILFTHHASVVAAVRALQSTQPGTFFLHGEAA